MGPTVKAVSTYTITLFIAGDLAAARAVVRGYCYEHGACFTITPTEFVYTGGEETGVAIGLVNYPRFPCEPHELWSRAEALGRLLLPALNQRTCLLVGANETRWLVHEPPGVHRVKARDVNARSQRK